MGQPLHAFDLARLAGPGIVVRRAADGRAHGDPGRRRARADRRGPGDRRPRARRGDRRHHGIGATPRSRRHDRRPAGERDFGAARRAPHRPPARTCAPRRRYRFERGADPEGPGRAAARAAQLIAAWSGGRVLAGAVEAGRDPSAPPGGRPALPRRRCCWARTRPTRDVREAFGRLRIEAEEAAEDEVEVEVPGYRVDLEIEVDLIEDVVRVRGLRPVAVDRARRSASRAGCSRLVRVPHAGPRGAGPRGPPRDELAVVRLRGGPRAHGRPRARSGVANPLAADEAFLRTSLLPRPAPKALRLNLAPQRPLRGAVRGRSTFSRARPPTTASIRSRNTSGSASRDRGGVDRLAGPGRASSTSSTPRAPSSRSWRRSGSRGGRWGRRRGPCSTRRGRPRSSSARRSPGSSASCTRTWRPGSTSRGAWRIAELETARARAARVDGSRVRRGPRGSRPCGGTWRSWCPTACRPRRVRAAVLGAVADLGVDAVLFDVFTGPADPRGTKSLAFAVDFRAAGPDPDRRGRDAGGGGDPGRGGGAGRGAPSDLPVADAPPAVGWTRDFRSRGLADRLRRR